MPKLSFKGYSWAAKKLRSEAVDEYMTRGEISSILNFSNARFASIRNSALFNLLYKKKVESAAGRDGKGSADWYYVEDFAKVLDALSTPYLQAVLIVDEKDLTEIEFFEKHGKTKADIFRGTSFLFDNKEMIENYSNY